MRAMIFDIFFYALLAWYFGHVLPNEVSVRLHACLSTALESLNPSLVSTCVRSTARSVRGSSAAPSASGAETASDARPSTALLVRPC